VINGATSMRLRGVLCSGMLGLADFLGECEGGGT
jgi:hypothetical protein